ncbi:MAG: exodeoxyribonuclease V subunit alpha [Desulfobacterales bacterium]|nr:exodeoxyribonuclease V subunit alpha [Desulfobacterales bacterium]
MMPSLAPDLGLFYDQGLFTSLDYYFARTLCRAVQEKDPLVKFTCALTSRALSQGHICLDLNRICSQKTPLSDYFDAMVEVPSLQTWLDTLERSELVSENIKTPFVLDTDNRFYMGKYFDFQKRLIQNIQSRLSRDWQFADNETTDQYIRRFFTDDDPHSRAQQEAVKRALLNSLTVISGGPGTGKTYVTEIIRQILYQKAAENNEQKPAIISLAPTGKAASKMENGQTIHSVLKPIKNEPGFVYNKTNPLSADTVIIDEASMIDILLLTRLMEAIPERCRIIILGDRHQLSSIQAGSVFNDLCAAAALSSHVSVLDYNFRSGGRSGIEKLSRAINENNIDRVEDILTRGEFPDIRFDDLSRHSLNSLIQSRATQGFHALFRADTIETILTHLNRFKILCAHNTGNYGTLSINHLCENILRSKYNFGIDETLLRRIIMVRINDYERQLYNGDTGIVVSARTGDRAVFKSKGRAAREFRISDLPRHETAFAITIHKSQGSEFDTVLILIPDRLSPVLTRQLLYTGVTRARKKVIIAGNLEIIKSAVAVSVSRTSGLTRGLDKIVQ